MHLVFFREQLYIPTTQVNLVQHYIAGARA